MQSYNMERPISGECLSGLAHKVSQEKKRKNLAMLAETPRLNRCFFSARLSSSNIKTVALTRALENAGENHATRFKAPFTLSLAGHIDMLFIWCFCLQSLVSAYCSGECCFLPSHSLACGNTLVRIHCSDYIMNSLLAANYMCS